MNIRVKTFLICLFALMFGCMTAATIRATMLRSVFDNGALIGDVWFQATLLDAYLGFVTFFVWVAWKEGTVARGLIWFVLIMSLGNIAMSGYMLWQLLRLPPGAGLSELFARNRRPLAAEHDRLRL
jgi:hypothetical protein